MACRLDHSVDEKRELSPGMTFDWRGPAVDGDRWSTKTSLKAVSVWYRSSPGFLVTGNLVYLLVVCWRLTNNLCGLNRETIATGAYSDRLRPPPRRRVRFRYKFYDLRLQRQLGDPTDTTKEEMSEWTNERTNKESFSHSPHRRWTVSFQNHVSWRDHGAIGRPGQHATESTTCASEINVFSFPTLVHTNRFENRNQENRVIDSPNDRVRDRHAEKLHRSVRFFSARVSLGVSSIQFAMSFSEIGKSCPIPGEKNSGHRHWNVRSDF